MCIYTSSSSVNVTLLVPGALPLSTNCVPYAILGGPEQNGTSSHLPDDGVQAADATTEAVERRRGADAATRRQAWRRPLRLHGACKAAALPCG